MDPKTEILLISERASKAKAERDDVIDGTIGMLMGNDGELAVIPAVSKTFGERLNFKYPPISGDPRYKDLAFQWVFGDSKAEAEKNNEVNLFGTLGGTGAVFMAMRYAGHQDYEILIPDIAWPNYKTIAEANGLSASEYSLFTKEGGFNFPAVEAKVREAKKNHRGFMLIVNDPCENPTGYSLTREEGEELYEKVAEWGEEYNISASLLFDIAYLDFAAQVPSWLAIAARGQYGGVETFIAFSASKTFSCYGLRIGELIALKPKPAPLGYSKALVGYLSKLARGIYSMPNGTGMRALAKIMDPAVVRDTKAQVHAIERILRERGNKIGDSLKSLRVPFLPYKEGFFLTVATNGKNAVDITQALEREGIYLVPMPPHFIRVSIGSLKSGQESPLAKALAKEIVG